MVIKTKKRVSRNMKKSLKKMRNMKGGSRFFKFNRNKGIKEDSYSPIKSEKFFKIPNSIEPTGLPNLVPESIQKADLPTLVKEYRAYEKPGEFDKFLSDQRLISEKRKPTTNVITANSTYVNYLKQQISEASPEQIRNYKKSAGITSSIKLPSQFGFEGNKYVYSNMRG
jgi:hypothetical protein